jgi:hypothetical protein
MRRTVVAAAVLAALVAAPADAIPTIYTAAYVVLPSPALVNGTGAEAYGLTCGMVTATDNPGSQYGVVVGAAVTVPTTHIDVTCTVQVGTVNNTHDKPDTAVATASGEGIALVANSVTYPAPEDADVYLCTMWRFAGTDYFFDAAAGVFSTSGTVACELATQLEVDSPIVTDLTEILDPTLCPLLAAVFPPEGDIPGIWDCPPYDA